MDVIPETRIFIVSLISVAESTRSNTKAPSSPGLRSISGSVQTKSSVTIKHGVLFTDHLPFGSVSPLSICKFDKSALSFLRPFRGAGVTLQEINASKD